MYQGIHLKVLETVETSSASVAAKNTTKGSSSGEKTYRSSCTPGSTSVQTSEMLHFKDTKVLKEKLITTEGTQIKGKVIARILKKMTGSTRNEEIPITTTTGFSTKGKTDQFASESTSVQTCQINLKSWSSVSHVPEGHIIINGQMLANVRKRGRRRDRQLQLSSGFTIAVLNKTDCQESKVVSLVLV